MILVKIIKIILIKIHLNLVGAWKVVQEQIYDRHKPLPKDLPEQSGKTIVITGGSRGIGLEAVKTLLKLDANLIIGVRKPEEMVKTIDKLRNQGLTRGSFEALELDLMSLESVRKFGGNILAKNIPIHVLINNAGIMFGPRKETIDGFEQQLATNHLGHFLLTHILLPKLKSTGKAEKFARVVNVSSAAHFCGNWTNFDDLQSKAFYSPEGAYGTSKAAQVMTSLYLTEKLKSEEDKTFVTFNSLHPGVVKTDLYTHEKWLTVLCGFLMKSASQGGDTLVHAALAPELEGKSGLYLENSQIATPSSFSRRMENQVKMFSLSCELCGIMEF